MSEYHDALTALDDMLSHHDPRRPMVRLVLDHYNALLAIEDYVSNHPYSEVKSWLGRKGYWQTSVLENGMVIGHGANPSQAMAIMEALEKAGNHHD